MNANAQFSLRPLVIDDAESLAQQLNSKKLWDNLRDRIPYPYTVADARGFIEFQANDSSLTCYAIEAHGKVVGTVGMERRGDVERFSAEVGYYIGEPYWGRGIMTAALNAAMEHYFASTDVVRLFATPFAFNQASAKVLTNVGFTFKCTLAKAAYKNGAFVDMLYYEKLK